MAKPKLSGEWMPPPPTKPVTAWTLAHKEKLVLNSHGAPYIFKTRLLARSFFTHSRYKPVRVIITEVPK